MAHPPEHLHPYPDERRITALSPHAKAADHAGSKPADDDCDRSKLTGHGARRVQPDDGGESRRVLLLPLWKCRAGRLTTCAVVCSTHRTRPPATRLGTRARGNGAARATFGGGHRRHAPPNRSYRETPARGSRRTRVGDIRRLRRQAMRQGSKPMGPRRRRRLGSREPGARARPRGRSPLS